MRRTFLLKIIGPNGEQRELPRGSIASVSWMDEQQGGWTSCTIETHVPVSALPTVQNGDEVWIYVLHQGVKQRRFTGKIVRRSVNQDTGTTLTLSCDGKSSDIRRVMLNRQYFRAGPPDMSVLFNDMAQDVVQKYPEVSVSTALVGLNKGIYEAFMMPFGDAADDLVRSSGNRSSWGVRGTLVEPYQDSLELRRNVSLDGIIGVTGRGRVLSLPQRSVSASSGESDATDIRNVLWLRGGPPVYPNLIQNSDFRLIEQSSADVGNLLLSPSFEDRSNWTLASGASYKSGGLSEGATYHGEDMVELDNTGEVISQIRSGLSGVLLAGHTFRLEAFMRREIGTGTSQNTMALLWLDAGLATLQTDARVCVSTNAIWENYALESVVPVGADGFQVEVYNNTPSMMVDAMSLYDVSLVVPRFLELWCVGLSTIKTVNWIQSAVRHPHRSAYAPEIAINVYTSFDNDDFYRLGHRTTADGGDETFAEVVGNASYRVTVDAISPKAPLAGYYKNGQFFLEIKWYKSDGTSAGSDYSTSIIAAGSGITEWTQYALTMTAPSNAVRARVSLVFTTAPTYSGGEQAALGVDSSENGVSRIIIAALAMRRSDAPALVESRYYGAPAFGVGTQYEYIPDGPYQGVVSVTDVMDIGSDEYNSIETYGEHPTFVDESSVTNQADLITFAEGFFAAYSVARPTGSIDVEGDTRYVVSSDGLRLTGDRGRAVSGAIVAITKVEYTFDGKLNFKLSWGGAEVDDPYTIFQMIIDSRRNSGGLGAGGGYYGTSGSSSSGGTTGGTGGTGTAGSQIFTGDDVPDDSSGSDNDFYLDNLTGDYYKKISGAWVLQGNLKGADGADGTDGADGADGLPKFIKDEGTLLTSRDTMNFVGDGVHAYDDGVQTVVEIDGGVTVAEVVDAIVTEWNGTEWEIVFGEDGSVLYEI